MLTQTLSVVIPVYRAGEALQETVREFLRAAAAFAVAPQVDLHLDEVILVVDNPGLSALERAAGSSLDALDSRVRTVWLARNFGQHPATVAGSGSTHGDWVVTMDEDGQHDPREIPEMLLIGARANAPLVYARPTNAPPHGALRNTASRATKRLFRVLSNSKGDFHSFRLIEGPIARSACAYIGDNVYLDVAMQWSCGDAAFAPMLMRAESTTSSYSPRKLLSHFWRMVLSTGTRPLRLIAVGGVLITLLGLLVAVVVAQRRLTGEFPAPGWTSVMITQLILAGGVFITLATLAEYIGFAVRNTIGKPLYVKTEHADARVLWTLQTALQGEPAPVR